VRTGEAFYPDHAPGYHRVPVSVRYEAREPSGSISGLKYTVRQLGDGSWSCTCLGFDYGHVCRHIRKHKILAARPVAILPGMFRPAYC
jgi:hypothetical protein